MKMEQTLTSSSDCNNHQITGNGNTINNYHFNTSLTDLTEEVAKKLMQSVFVELSEATKIQIQNNQSSYFQELCTHLKNIKKDQEMLKVIVASPDFQYGLKQSLIVASRFSDSNIHKMLSVLLVHRINNDSDTFKQLLYREALQLIDKITVEQLNILTICLLLTRTRAVSINSIVGLENYLLNTVGPFINFEKFDYNFRYIIYLGCATVPVITGRTLEHLFKKNYPDLFPKQKPILEGLSEASFINTLNKAIVNTSLLDLDLTPPGIALASIFYEKNTGCMNDINIWLK